ncbi:hypothetical protein D3C85_1754540 [compost metagenome]
MQITPRLGLDSGWVQADRGAPNHYLSGAGIGVNLSWKNLHLDLDYQRSVSMPEGFKHEPRTWLMRVGWQI